MKKASIIVLLLLLGLALPTFAQKRDKKEEEARVQLARDRYAEGLSAIATNKEYEQSEIPAVNYTTIVRQQNWAGSGMTNDKMEFYYNELEDEEEYSPQPVGYQLVIMRRTYNMGEMEHFEEYVYDEDGKPLFWFTRFGWKEGNSYKFKIELRGYYYPDGTLARTISKRTDENGEMKTCSINDRISEYDEETFEDYYAQAFRNFKKFNTAFQTLYKVEY